MYFSRPPLSLSSPSHLPLISLSSPSHLPLISLLKSNLPLISLSSPPHLPLISLSSPFLALDRLPERDMPELARHIFIQCSTGSQTIGVLLEHGWMKEQLSYVPDRFDLVLGTVPVQRLRLGVEQTTPVGVEQAEPQHDDVGHTMWHAAYLSFICSCTYLLSSSSHVTPSSNVFRQMARDDTTDSVIMPCRRAVPCRSIFGK